VDDLDRFAHWTYGAENTPCDAAVRITYQSGQNTGAFTREVSE
jgi:hypothetical protein